MTTFYIEPDPDETDPLLLAHNAELKRRRAKPGNYGKYIGPGEIMSRTDKGDLSTIMRDGEAKHFWRAMAENARGVGETFRECDPPPQYPL